MIRLLLFFFGLVFLLISFFLRQKRGSNQKKTSFESGFRTLGKVTLGYRLHFFFLVLVFVFFDLELIFLLVLVFTNYFYIFVFGLTIFLVILGFLIEWKIKKLIWFI